MDFGTITTKVERGKYRSLEEFTSDVRLVTSNAKLFNPPGSIYYTEADRIEAFALSHISKAASTVIEYEADWNIDIEHEDEGRPSDEFEEDTHAKGTPMDVDGSARGRSPSVASTQTPLQTSRRNAKAGPSKKQPGMVAESWEDDGHLPGHKDGLGQFPPGSDFAQLMLALKLKGKRYRTKKERLRMERGGPPFAVDGSLDYSEMEDPFTVLSVLLPEPPSKPLLTPIYPSQPITDPSEHRLPAPINLSPDRPTFQSTIPTEKRSSSANKGKQRRRHWLITRTTVSRGKGKEREEEETVPPWKTPREPHTVDWGSFAILVDKIAQENHARGVSVDLSSTERLLDVIKQSVEPKLDDYELEAKLLPDVVPTLENYWDQRARQAQDYLQDVVYGGVEGLAYVRSLAEFCRRPDDMKFEDGGPTYSALGMPLAKWVEQNVVDHVTEGRHRLLREASLRLQSPKTPIDPTTARYVDLSLHVYPRILRQVYELRQIAAHKLDMAALIKEPDELFLADNVWAGATFLKEQRQKMEEEVEKALAESPEKNAADYLAFAIQSHKEAESTPAPAYEGPEVITHALNFSADLISELGSSRARKRDRDTMEAEDVKMEDGGEPGKSDKEERLLKKLRLNLLALAKRAPLDTVARLPADLVPEHIRPYIPTLASIPASSSTA
ncbi:unnamed protein product [Somion occarium]